MYINSTFNYMHLEYTNIDVEIKCLFIRDACMSVPRISIEQGGEQKKFIFT